MTTRRLCSQGITGELGLLTPTDYTSTQGGQQNAEKQGGWRATPCQPRWNGSALGSGAGPVTHL